MKSIEAKKESTFGAVHSKYEKCYYPGFEKDRFARESPGPGIYESHDQVRKV